MKTPLRVIILCGGPSSEHEVSLRSARMILKNLDKKKYKPTLVALKKEKGWHADLMKCLLRSKFDFAIIAMHGAFGEDGRMQSILEIAGIPYWGSGVVSSAMAMNKDVSNQLYEKNNIRVASYVVVTKKNNSRELSRMRFPVVVKPLASGSSVGVSIVNSHKNFAAALGKSFKEGASAMVQEYVKGREFTCGIIEGKGRAPMALPPTEIIPKAATFFDYDAKYQIGASLEVTPAKLLKKQTHELQAMALLAHHVLRCRGMSRSDFILEEQTGHFYILETNTIPGMTETSLLPQAAKVAGISFSKLLDMMISSGL